MSAEYDHGSTVIGRRDFAKAVGAAGAIGAGATASSTTATAADGLVDGIASAIPGSSTAAKVAYGVAGTTGVGSGVVFGAVALQQLDDAVESSPSADRTILHNLCTSEFESLTAHEMTLENRLTDAKPVASIEARHGIASAWEAGESASSAYDRAMSRIRQYYELIEFNHWHVTAKSLLQLGFAGEAAIEDGSDAFVAATGSDGSGNDIQFRFRGETKEVDLTLHDGTSIGNVNSDEADDVTRSDGSAKLKVPVLHVRDVTNSTDLGTTPVLEQSVVDSWDSSNETLTYDVNGTTCTLDSKFTVPGVNDLNTAHVWDYTETFRLHGEITSQSDTVTGNYSQTFVEDVFGELDAGNITPKEVRSPEGVARFLSGTDDPAAARFRVAMLQQLGMAQPDFARVASMDVTYSGATDRTVDTDPGLDDRYTYASEFVDSKQYNGVLFGDHLPKDGFQPGNSYQVGPTVYVTSDGANIMRAVNPSTGETLWEKSPGITHAVAESPDNTFVAVAGGNSFTAYDAKTGDQLWSYGSISTADDVAISYDSSTVYAVDEANYEVHAIDASDGSQKWLQTYSNNIPAVATLHDSDGVFIAAYNNSEVRRLDPADGSTTWTYTKQSTADYDPAVLAVSPDDSTVYAHGPGNTLEAIDVSDGSGMWTVSQSAEGSSLDTAKDAVFVGLNNGEVVGIDADTQNEFFRHAIGSSNSLNGTAATDRNTVYIAGWNGNVECVNVADGTVRWSTKIDRATNLGITTPRQPVDGMAGSALMFDEESNTEYHLTKGVLEVNEVTDRDGAQVTHVTDQTIADLEALSGTPDSISTIVSEMDEFDSESDIKYKRHVEQILDHYGVDATIGESDDADVTIVPTDYQEPAYNTYNSTEWADYMAKSLEQYKEQLEKEKEAALGGGGGGFFNTLGNGVLMGAGILVGGYVLLKNN